MSYKPVHLHTNILHRKFNIFLLLIPALIFILLLSLISISFRNDQRVAKVDEQTVVLGDETENP